MLYITIFLAVYGLVSAMGNIAIAIRLFKQHPDVSIAEKIVVLICSILTLPFFKVFERKRV